MTISVDVRERRSDVPRQLALLGMRVATTTLAVGDYAFGDRVIERKTVADLHRSLAGRTLWSQVGALRRDPRRAYILVEGADLDDGPVSARALRGALFKILDNGIRLLRTESPTDTALWLHVLARQEKSRIEQRAKISGRRTIAVSPVGLIAAIPGISVDGARALLREFGSIAAIAAASEPELQRVPGIGPHRAAALRSVLVEPAA